MKLLAAIAIAILISTAANANSIFSKAVCFPEYSLCFTYEPDVTNYVTGSVIAGIGGCFIAGQLVNTYYVHEIEKRKRTREDEQQSIMSCILPFIGPWLVHQSWKGLKPEILPWYNSTKPMYNMHNP